MPRWPPSTSARRAAASRSAGSTASGSRSTRCTASRTCRSSADGVAPLGRSSASTATCSTASRRRRDATVDSVAVDSWAVDFGLLDARRPAAGEPRPLPRRAPRRRGRARARRVPARELYERTGIQLLPINTIFELGGDGRRRRPGARRRRDAPADPRPRPSWLCGSRTTELTNATTTQCFDPRAGELGASTSSSGSTIPTGCFPRSCAGDAARCRRAGRREATGLGARRGRGRDARHRLRRRGRSVRPSELGFLSVGTWSLVGSRSPRPLITDATFAANLTNEGGVGGHVPAAAQRHRALAAARVPPRLGGRGSGYSFDELSSSRGPRLPFQSLVDPTTVVRDAGRHAGAHRRLLRAHRSTGPPKIPA